LFYINFLVTCIALIITKNPLILFSISFFLYKTNCLTSLSFLTYSHFLRLFNAIFWCCLRMRSFLILTCLIFSSISIFFYFTAGLLIYLFYF
jgi:hypothetical protein